MLNGEIFRQRLKIANTHVVADTIDYLEMKFTFLSDDWDGLEKWAHFAKNGAVYDIRLTEDCVRKEDHLNLSAGIWKVYLHGNEFADGKVIERITTNTENLRVVPTGTLDGEPFPEMPASMTEQILARLENLEENGGGGGGITRETDPTVPEWAKQPEKPEYTAEEVGAMPASTKIPSKTSELSNDSGFITKAVSDLANYYSKSQTYTRTEINERISAIPKFAISVVSSLPTTGISTTTIYLVKSGSGADLYTEYIYTGGSWEILGSQRVDLTGYATEAWVNAKIADFLTADKLTAAMVTGALGFTPAKDTDVPAVDSTLTQAGKAADAKAVGDKFEEVSEAISSAQTDAENAMSLAEGADQKADDALAEAQEAASDASQARSTAASAESTANTAQSAAGTAQRTADDAVGMFDSLPAWAKEPVKPEYTADEVGALPADTEIPEKTSDLQNDSGFITGYTETDPTVPGWAKQPKKPTYTADEVGALPATTKIPANTSDLNNNSGFITKAVTDLANYYAKSQTYSRDEINERISAIPKFVISVVNVLPTTDISTTTVYLVKSGSDTDLYTEYIFIVDGNAPEIGDGTYDETSGTWEILGSQRVDLTGYATETWVNAKIADFLTADKLTAAMVTGALGFTPAKATDVPAVDTTLTQAGKAADAKAVGDKVNQLSEEIADLLPKNQGAANAGKILVVGTDGNLVLTDMPEGGAGGDVTGVFDENNNILLSGNIAAGTYTLMFENADGSYAGSGTLVVTEVVPEPTWTNFADPASEDWLTECRLSGDISGTTPLTGGIVTNYVSAQTGDIFEVTGINFADANNRTGYHFNSTNEGILKGTAMGTSNSFTDVAYSANSLICTVVADCDDNAQIRFSGLPTGASDDVVIKIKRNGEYL